MPLKVAASANKVAKPAAKTKAAAPPKSKLAQTQHSKAAKKAAPAAAKSAKSEAVAIAKKPSAHVQVAPHVAAAQLNAKTAAAPQRTVAVPANAHKAASQKISAPVASAQQPAVPKDVAEKAAAARQILAVQKKPVSQRHGFKANEFIVYPAHGVGRIVGIEEQEIAGMSLELFVITFDKEKLTLRVPTGKLASVGMRKLADEGLVKKAMETLKGRARIKRTMWSRRAQEYVAKINSGDLISIAEVVRDLYRSEAQPEQSYSERQLYEDALDRMARELAAVEKLDERGAVQRITDILSKSAKGRRLAESDAAPVEEEAA
jgi:CarD family transcriptional regulator